MNLEDHLGDVIRKARAMAGVSTAQTASAACLSENALVELEASGQCPAGISFSGLAGVLGLNPSKLEQLARGWLPAEKDMGAWRELRQITTIENGNAVHCYLAWDEVTRDGALFDTGWDAGPVLQVLRENEVQLRHIFITHTHIDHMAGLQQIRDQFPKALLHTDAKSAPPQHRNRRNDCIHVGSLRITNRETPGHAEDGVTYIIGNWPEDASHIAVVGDTIFAGSVGGASSHGALARERIRGQILSLPADTLLCPGHGPLTTVAEEKDHNPFF